MLLCCDLFFSYCKTDLCNSQSYCMTKCFYLIWSIISVLQQFMRISCCRNDVLHHIRRHVLAMLPKLFDTLFSGEDIHTQWYSSSRFSRHQAWNTVMNKYIQTHFGVIVRQLLLCNRPASLKRLSYVPVYSASLMLAGNM